MTKLSRNWPIWMPTAILVFLLSGCGGYGEVSPNAYEYAQALYSITNRQSVDGLDRIEEQISTALERSEITETEAPWLKDIVSDAREGNWESANSAARRMMEDQLK